MSLRKESINQADIIEMPQRLSLAEAGELRESIHQLIEAGCKHLVLDLQHVSFIDSSGLSVLLSARKGVMQQQGEVILLNVTDQTRALIELTRLHEVFEIFSDRAAAIARFN